MRAIQFIVRVGVACAAVGPGAAPAAGQLLFAEDFESFPLFQNQDEGVDTGVIGCQELAFIGDAVACGEQNTQNPGCGPDTIDCAGRGFANVKLDGQWTFAGWNATFSLPGVGTREWQGWSVADAQWWQTTARDQGRADFTSASGKVLVADPDEWADYDPIYNNPEQVGPYDTEIISPVVDISQAMGDDLVVRFDSSWRPESDLRNQQARVSVRFDGRAWEEYLYWSSDPGDPDFHDDAPNETIELKLANPAGAATLEVSFELFDAANDWWWALDDVKVFIDSGGPVEPPEPFELSVAAFYADTTPDIGWTQSINATNYEVTFALDEAFTKTVIEHETTELAFTPNAGELLAGVYFVRVVARNSLGTYEQSAPTGLDNPCPSDLDGDGESNTRDFLRYLNMWSAGCD